MNDALLVELRRLKATMVMDGPLPGLHILDSSLQQLANVVSSIFLIWKQTPSGLNEITIIRWVVPYVVLRCSLHQQLTLSVVKWSILPSCWFQTCLSSGHASPSFVAVAVRSP